MPIRRELLPLYPANWQEISFDVRFNRAGGRCEQCGRPHLAAVLCLPDGRWFDQAHAAWRDGSGKPACSPNTGEAIRAKTTRVVIAAAHFDNDPSRSDRGNLRAWCQRCHLLHDKPYHLAQRWITYRGRWAIGDLFLGSYDAAVLTAGHLVDVLRRQRPARPSVAVLVEATLTPLLF